MNINLLDYDGVERTGLTRSQIPTNYELRLNF